MAGNPAARNRIADALLTVEEELRQVNAPLWKLCGLHAYKTQKEEWSAKQTETEEAAEVEGALKNGLQRLQKLKEVFKKKNEQGSPGSTEETETEEAAEVEGALKNGLQRLQ